MDEHAPRFIAIRRDAAAADSPVARVRAAISDFAVRRAHLLAPARNLARVGLEEEALAVADLPADPAVGGFVPLPETQSLILEPPAGVSLEDVADALGDEYLVMPDVELTLPVPLNVEHVPAEQAHAAAAVLPEESGVRTAHEAGNQGAGVVVAILDTGCDADHREFAGRVIDFLWAPLRGSSLRNVRGFDTATHGTHVSGIVGGANVGVSPGVDLVVAAVIESETLTTSTSRIWEALTWLLRRIAEPQYEGKPVILNMSLGFRSQDIEADLLASTMEGMRLLLREFLEKEKVLPIVAIGNEGPGQVRAPGFYPEALSVGAVDYQTELWPKSGGGAGPPGFETEMSPDVVGFGVDIVSSIERDISGQSWYGKKRGTSMATPYVAGVAALVAAATKLEGVELRDWLLHKALPLQHGADRVGRGLARYVV